MSIVFAINYIKYTLVIIKSYPVVSCSWTIQTGINQIMASIAY